MTFPEHPHSFADMVDASRGKAFGRLQKTVPAPGLGYDLELLYVECHKCGRPVLWDTGKTTRLLKAAGVDLHTIDERCMILSDGCPVCSPNSKQGFPLTVVRVAGLTPEEAVLMEKPGGHS